MSQPPVFDLLQRAARDLVVELDASACAVSRVLGEVLVQVAEHVGGRPTLQLGAGYLVGDYPETKAVLDTRTARALSLDDPDVDAAEADLLRALGYDALLMLPLVVRDEVWGLVEVYRGEGRPFAEAELASAEESVRLLGERLPV